MKKYFYFIFAIFGILASRAPVLALEYPFGGLKGDPSPCQYISTAYTWGLGIVGGLAVAVIAYGGFLYMVGKIEQGKDYITSAFLGVLLLFGAYLILYTINPELAKLNCRIENLQIEKMNEAVIPDAPPSLPVNADFTCPDGYDRLTNHATGKYECVPRAETVDRNPDGTCPNGYEKFQDTSGSGLPKIRCKKLYKR